MKEKKRLITYHEQTFDSPEEREFYWWCEEALRVGMIKQFDYHPDPFKLSDKVSVTTMKQLKSGKMKQGSKSILKPHEYTPDYVLKVGQSTPILSLYPTFGVAYIDIKGGFSLYNNHREFSVNQKWVYQKYGIYVNKVVPEKFFNETWVPEQARLTEKTRQVRKKYVGCKTVDEYIGG